MYTCIYSKQLEQLRNESMFVIVVINVFVAAP